MEKIKLLAVIGLSFIVGCSHNESVTKPGEDSASSTTTSSANINSSTSVNGSANISSSADINSSASVNSSAGTTQDQTKEPVWNSQYSMILNEGDNSFIVQYNFDLSACSITESSAEWIVNLFEFPLEFKYEIQGNKLTIWSADDESSKSTFTGSNKSLLGIWKSTNNETSIKFTQDTYYTTESESNASQPAVESEIDLTSSYAMYDLYSCGTEGYNCAFGHWHFTKKAPDFILDLIAQKVIDVHEKTDRFANLTFAGKNLTINVEHVQLDSLNNGRHYIEATIQSQGDTCRFKHYSEETTKELCIAENLEYLSEYAYLGDDDRTYSIKYFTDNEVEFNQCVSTLLK